MNERNKFVFVSIVSLDVVIHKFYDNVACDNT
jgi:hypothetical protein